MPLVPITSPAFDLDIDLRYATADNLTGEPVYASAIAMLHPEAAAALLRAIRQATRLGLRLRLLDAYRPPEAQWIFWRRSPNPEFVADPRKGSPHGRGVAVDLTLIGPDGRELDMGTGFDAFLTESHHGASGLGVEAERNRLTLLGLMATAGFELYRYEWWHYQMPDAGRYPLLADGAGGPRLM